MLLPDGCGDGADGASVATEHGALFNVYVPSQYASNVALEPELLAHTPTP